MVHRPERGGVGWGRTLLLGAVPVLVCAAILSHTSMLYGTCKAPSQVTSVEGLQTYLSATAATLRRRSAEQADALLRVEHELTVLNASRDALAAAKEQAQQLSKTLASQQEQLGAAQTAGEQKAQEVVKLQAETKQLNEALAKAKEARTQQPSAQAAADGQVPPLSGGRTAEEARLHVLEVAGLQCNADWGQEYWASHTLQMGYNHRSVDAADCCAACHAWNAAVDRNGTEKGRNATRCNIWAVCTDKEKCGPRLGECWIRHEQAALQPPPARVPGARSVPGWVSGAVYPNDLHLERHAASNASFMLHTTVGDIEIVLLPHLAPITVRELRRMASLLAPAGGYCSGCKIYRAVNGFVVQGQLEHPGVYVGIPRYPSPPQPMVMPKGMICWASDTGGPHFFYNAVDQGGFKDLHLCWGQVPARDFAVFDKILALPRKEKPDKTPSEELLDHIKYNVSLKVP